MKIPHLKLESLACTTLTLLVAIGCGEDPKPQSESRLPLAPGATPGANLPRPTPSETLDPISARVIGRRAILLLDEPNAATWTNYADACLMNLWPGLAMMFNGLLSDTQSGRLRWYAAERSRVALPKFHGL